MKTRFFYVILTVMLISSQTFVMAQNSDGQTKRQRPSQEEVIQMQTNHMIKALMLDDATAAKFSPVYENYLKELRECRMMNHKPRVTKSGRQTKDAKDQIQTDTEIEKNIKDQFVQSRKMLDIRESYYNEFRKILAPKQIWRIYQMERIYVDKFKKEFDRRKHMKNREKHQGRSN